MVDSMESMNGKHAVIPASREPCAVKAARTVLTGGMGKRAVRQRALSLPTRNFLGGKQLRAK